jgi:hypothetical protein
MRRAALFLVLTLGLASCETYRTFLPLGNPIRRTDKVRTKEQAIKIGMNCGFESGDPSHWEANLHADLWHVTWANGQNTIEVQVAKKDGAVLSCDVDDDDTLPGK